MFNKKIFLVFFLAFFFLACGESKDSGDELSFGLKFFGYPEPQSDVSRGSTIFGLDTVTGKRITNCNPGSGCIALVEGIADDGHTQIASNGRVCTDCHRPEANLQLGAVLPLNQHVPADDPLLVFVHADSQFNPDAVKNLNDDGLILIRPHRFKGLSEDDPYRKVISWRKVPTNFNLAFAHGFLADLRASQLKKVDESALQSHTQLGDIPFNNIVPSDTLKDLAAFQFSLFTDKRLEALLYPGDNSFSPSFDELANDPYLTVPISTESQLRGKEVFNRFCYLTCHNVPNVFNNRAQLNPARPEIPGQGYDIGISQANKLNLDFSFFNTKTGLKELVTLPLTTDNGEIRNVPITIDPGIAAISRRFEDLYVFKVPQLRGLAAQRTYMHDGSLKSLEEVAEYFNSDHFNNSSGGRAFPIHMTPQEQADLVEFLKVL